jgi:hypothetical protein
VARFSEAPVQAGSHPYGMETRIYVEREIANFETVKGGPAGHLD